MRGQVEMLLERGIKAAQAGESERARDLLINVIELDERNENAWLWLSFVVESTADKIVCLENILTINPSDEEAAEELDRLLREHPLEPSSPSSTLPRLTEAQGVAARICPRCGYRNPGWIYLCDRCGADLQPVDPHEALSSGAKPRGRGSVTILAAWTGALVFDRFLAFLPEIKLASWRRSLAALVLAAFCASAWRAVASVVLQGWIGDCEPSSFVSVAIIWMMGSLALGVSQALVWIPAALLTWLGARAMGGRQSFKSHAHLIAVVLSAWTLLTALLTPLVLIAPFLLDIESLAGGTLALIVILTSLAGVVWLKQAIQTAHHLSGVRAILATTVAVLVALAALFSFAWLSEEGFSSLLSVLHALFMPWLG